MFASAAARARACGLIVAAAAAILAGCGSNPAVQQYVAPSAVCCASFPAMPFRPMPLGQEIELSFDSGTPAYDFSGRRRHFAALKIPDGFAASMLQVRSYLSGTFVWDMGAVLPEFIFLDDGYKVLATRATENYQRADGFWRTGVSGRVAVPPQARYFVVRPGDGSGGMPNIHSDNGRPINVTPAAVGDFSLRIFGEHRK